MMNMQMLAPAVLAAAMSFTAVSVMAAVPIDLLGVPAQPADAARTIKITPDTEYVNVQSGETVTFDVGGKTFTWNFDTGDTVDSFDLSQIAPAGVLDHPVTAYLAPNPVYLGG
jgi:hypothetical protein